MASSDYLVFAGETPESQAWAKNLCHFLGCEVAPSEVVRFKDQESQPRLKVSVSNKKCIVVNCLHQTATQNSNDSSFVLFQICHALHTSQAEQIIVVAPYTAYARQDKPDDNRSCVTGGLFPTLLKAACGSTPVRFITFDLHAGQLWTVYKEIGVWMDNLHSEPHMISFVKEVLMKKQFITSNEIMVVAPDAGAAKRATRFADEKTGLNCPYALMSKIRIKANEVASVTLVGDVKGKHCIIPDDMCDTGGTICAAAHKLKEEGAASVVVMFGHGVFSGPALDRLQTNESINMVVFTNTCNKSYEVGQMTTLGDHDNISFQQLKNHPKFFMVDITWLMSQAVKCRLTQGSVSKLFELRCTSEKDMLRHIPKTPDEKKTNATGSIFGFSSNF